MLKLLIQTLLKPNGNSNYLEEEIFEHKKVLRTRAWVIHSIKTSVLLGYVSLGAPSWRRISDDEIDPDISGD